MGKGHNFYGGLSAEHLKQFIERLERLDEEKKNIAADIKEVFAEAKSAGFDTKVMRQILKLRKVDESERDEQEYLLDTYKRALGMIPDLFDEDDNPAIKANQKEDVLAELSGGLKGLKVVDDIRKFGDKVRKVAKENGISELNIHAFFVAKAAEIERRVKLPYEEVIAIMKGEDDA